MTRGDFAKLGLCLGMALALSACSYHSVAFPLEQISTRLRMRAFALQEER